MTDLLKSSGRHSGARVSENPEPVLFTDRPKHAGSGSPLRSARNDERAADRVAALFEGTRRRAHVITTPEGVELRTEVAGRTERLAAFALDMLLWMLVTALLFAGVVYLLAERLPGDIAATLALFLAFLVRLLYFIHFELAWRGRTPGKRALGLRVIDRAGGALTGEAVVARNLIREVEVFLPAGLFLSLAATHGMDTWQRLTTFGWIVAIAAIPLFNKEHLRAGDLIAGTIVIATPKRRLAADLSGAEAAFSFSPRQLRAYGAFELQVLEELLRQPPSPATRRLHREVAEKIGKRIGWREPVAAADTERFLRDFYVAERADLEREQLFGRGREDKGSVSPQTSRANPPP